MGSAFHQLCPRYHGTLTPSAPTANRLWETFTLLLFHFVKPACSERDIAVTILLKCMCVLVCMRVSVRICLGHNSYIYAWISKLFDTVIVLEEE